MAVWRKRINNCEPCGGTGWMPTPRASWEAPLYGDDTIPCPHCRGEPSSVQPAAQPPPEVSPAHPQEPSTSIKQEK